MISRKISHTQRIINTWPTNIVVLISWGLALVTKVPFIQLWIKSMSAMMNFNSTLWFLTWEVLSDLRVNWDSSFYLRHFNCSRYILTGFKVNYLLNCFRATFIYVCSWQLSAVVDWISSNVMMEAVSWAAGSVTASETALMDQTKLAVRMVCAVCVHVHSCANRFDWSHHEVFSFRTSVFIQI